jgi:SPP1 family predicted phage head-tail adaptor
MIESTYTGGYIIEKATATTDGMGGSTEAWSTHLTIEGHLREQSGNERLNHNKETVYATHRFYTASADITERHRLKDSNDSNKIYEILFVAKKKDANNIVRHLELDLLEIR